MDRSFARSAALVAAILEAAAPTASALAGSPFSGLSREERRGLLSMPEEPGDDSFVPRRALGDTVAGELPPSFSWRDCDGVDWLMPIRDQSQCGSCAAFGITALLEFRVKLDLAEPNLEIDLSDSQTLTCTGGSCSKGITLADGLSTLLTIGIPTEECAPYSQGTAPGSVVLTPCDGGCEGADRGRVRLTGVERLEFTEETPLAEQVAAMKAAIV